MHPIAKWSILTGAALIVFGVFWQFAGRFLPLVRLPGDIRIESGSTRVYFPIVTCIVISVVLSLLLTVWRFLNR